MTTPIDWLEYEEHGENVPTGILGEPPAITAEECRAVGVPRHTGAAGMVPGEIPGRGLASFPLMKHPPCRFPDLRP